IVQKLPPVYEAAAVILVDSQKIPSSMVPSTVTAGLQDRLANLAQQIFSSNRLQALIEQDGLYRDERKSHSMEDLVEEMRENLGIHLIHGIVTGANTARGTGSSGGGRGNPDAFSVFFRDSNPATAALVANQLANLFIEENLRARERYASDTSSFIDQQLDDAKKSLDQQEAKVSQFKIQHSGELPEQENALISVEGRLQAELQSSQDAIDRAQQNKVLYQNSLSMTEASLASLERASRQAAEDAASSSGGTGSTAAPAPKASDVLKGQLQALRLHYTDDFPEVKRVKRELAEVEALEKKQAAAAAGSPTQSANFTTPGGRRPDLNEAGLTGSTPTPLTPEILKERDQVASLKNQLTALDMEIQRRTAEQDNVRKQMAKYQNHLDQLPVSQQDLAKLTRDYEISRQNYQSLLNHKFTADMSTDMEMRQQSERFTLIEAATTPELPAAPNRPLYDGAAAIIAFGLALAIGFVLEFRKNLFLGEWELPNGMPVLGRVPAITLPLALNGSSEYSQSGNTPGPQPLRIT
ncbi:MAG: hypothetical protein ACRD40_05130, partial [Candidatus Acidiferrales bacterium]